MAEQMKILKRLIGFILIGFFFVLWPIPLIIIGKKCFEWPNILIDNFFEE